EVHMRTMLFLYKITLLQVLCTFSVKSADPLGEFCNKNFNTSTGSKISANIDHLLDELVLKTSFTGFTANSYGKKQEKVYGLAQCRGDVSDKECLICVKDAATEIIQRCPNQVDARIWF
ncbi:Cysteine-rich repeat secretory protein, partial [Quillaja saponaria]